MDYQQKAQPFIEEALRQGAVSAVAFSIEDIVFDSRALLKCRFGCPEWGKNYTCPSGTGISMEQYREMFSRYRWGIIIGTHAPLAGQKISYNLEAMAYHEGYYWAISLSDCSLCKTCGAATNTPCPHPERARPGFHSVGVDVFATVKKFNLPLYTLSNDGSQLPNWYAALFVE